MKKYVFYLILILLSLGLPLAGLELYGYYFEKDYAQFKNTYGDMHLYSQYRNHELNPDPNLFFPDSGMHHSPDGFKRDTPVAVEKPAGVYRIMMMGASALYGLGIKWPYPPHVGLKNSETVDRVVEAELNRELAARGEKTRVEIINSAVSGYTSLQQLTYFLENLYRYHSDMLVFLDGYNDYLVQKKDYRQFKDQPYFGGRVAEHLNKRSPLFAFYVLCRLFSQHSYAARMLEHKLFWQLILYENEITVERSQHHMTPDETAVEYKKNAEDSFQRINEMFLTLSKRYGFETSFFLQPMIMFEPNEQLSPQDIQIKDITLWHYQAYKYNLDVFAKMRSMLPGLFAEVGMPYHDLAQISDPSTKNEQLYIDYCHLAPLGAKRTGELLAAQLLPQLLASLEKKKAAGELP